MPEFIVLSFLIFPLILSKILNFFEKKIYGFKSKLFLIFLILIFPNIIILFSHYPLYDGMRLFLYLIPKYIKPTGFALVPPEGPAIPVVEIQSLLFVK